MKNFSKIKSSKSLFLPTKAIRGTLSINGFDTALLRDWEEISLNVIIGITFLKGVKVEMPRHMTSRTA